MVFEKDHKHYWELGDRLLVSNGTGTEAHYEYLMVCHRCGAVKQVKLLDD